MTVRQSYKITTLAEMREKARTTPRRACVEVDRVNGGFTWVHYNGNRKVETGGNFETRSKADYAMRQRFAGTMVRLWKGE
jgi:hypothetical protein